MSAYVVEAETINRILPSVEWGEEAYHLRRKYPDMPALGAAMYALNLDAVRQRYPDCETDEELPGIIGPKVYEYHSDIPEGKHQALKSLQCWLYQCSEGDVPERELYQDMRRFEYRLMSAIIVELPAYKAAQWA